MFSIVRVALLLACTLLLLMFAGNVWTWAEVPTATRLALAFGSIGVVLYLIARTSGSKIAGNRSRIAEENLAIGERPHAHSQPEPRDAPVSFRSPFLATAP